MKFFHSKQSCSETGKIKELVDELEGQQVWVLAELVSMKRERERERGKKKGRQIAVDV